MRFLNLWPLWLLLIIPFLILLYILKQKSQEKVVSSIMLWDEVYRNIQANTPFEKLKRNIMLFLQLTILLFIIMALMHPFIKYFGKNYNDIIIAIDNSASMSAMYNNKSRLENAKEIAKDYIKSYPKGTNISVICASDIIEFKVNSSKDMSFVNKKIDEIDQRYVKGDLTEAISLVKSIVKEKKEYEVVFLTDNNTLNIDKINGKVISLMNEGPNISIDNMSHVKKDKVFNLIATINNKGNNKYYGDFSLYGDEKLLDVKNVQLDSGKSITISFNVENFEGTYFKGELSGEDIIIEDNVFYDAIKEQENKKILLSVKDNIFLEKALMTISGVEIVKTTNPKDISEKDNFDLYIYDGDIGDYTPENGNLLLVNSLDNKFFKTSGITTGGITKVNKEYIPEYLKNIGFTTSKINKVQCPGWAKSLIDINESSAVFLGEYKGQSIGAINFDIHNSDLPLKPEFPILIYYICNELLPNGVVDGNNFSGGDVIPIKGDLTEEDIIITGPNNKIITVKPNSEFIEYTELGLYKVSQKEEDSINEDYFAINFPSNEAVSVIDQKYENNESDKIQNKFTKTGMDLTSVITFIILCLITLEWYFYRKGY